MDTWLANHAWPLGLVAFGLAILPLSPFLARYHTGRRRLDRRRSRALLANLLYNGTATALGGIALLGGWGIVAWLLLLSVPLLTMGVSALPARAPIE